uniref:Uncharacterized protein n=1 Tax=Parastrongyloides trichosuri TaxID=131310 RepID=A0A0N4ZSJ2_PARTI
MLLYIVLIATFIFTVQSCSPKKKKKLIGGEGGNNVLLNKTPTNKKIDDNKESNSIRKKKSVLNKSKLKSNFDGKKITTKEDNKKNINGRTEKTEKRKDSTNLIEHTAADFSAIPEDSTQIPNIAESESSKKLKKVPSSFKSLKKNQKVEDKDNNVNATPREAAASVKGTENNKKNNKKTLSECTNSLMGKSVATPNVNIPITNNYSCKTQVEDNTTDKGEGDIDKEYLNNKKKVNIDFDPSKINKDDVFNVGTFKVHKGCDIWACNSISK